MKVELYKNRGQKITADLEGLHALREALGLALELGHGFQSDGTLPEVVVVDERGKVMLPARPEKKVQAVDEKSLPDLDPDHVTNLKHLYGDLGPTSGRKEPAEPGIESERLDSGQE
jgi:hypothetical protein